MHIEEYITSVGKQHMNEKRNYEFHSISSLRKFLEGWEAVNQNLVKSDVIKSGCDHEWINCFDNDGPGHFCNKCGAHT